MYFYEVEVYHPLLGSEKIIVRHNDRFDNHQLNVIVQEAFDECIEKYSNKLSYDKGEEPCRMAVETIFEEYLPAQLQNHGFTNIKIDGTCSIMDGELFLDDGAINPALKKRYLDKALPPCKKCIRDECIVPNVRKDNNLPITLIVETKSNDKKDENKDDFNITVLKQYFINSCRSVEDSKIATNALYNILDRNKFEYYYVEYRTKTDSIYERDIFCWFDLGTDRKKFEKLLKNYGFTFIFDDEEDGFWITGVKE